MEIEQNGINSISVNEINSFKTGESVFLEDLLTGEWINLKEEKQYDFSGNISVENVRFVLHFTSVSTVIRGNENDDLLIYSSGKDILIKNTNNTATNLDIKVYDLTGRIVYSKSQLFDDSIQIEMQQTGIYIVEVINSEGVVRKELFIE